MFEELLCAFVDDNFHGRAVQERYLDTRDCEVGLFGDFLEQRGHGKHVEWVYDTENEGWVIKPVTTSGNMHVPRPAMVMDYVIQVRVEEMQITVPMSCERYMCMCMHSTDARDCVHCSVNGCRWRMAISRSARRVAAQITATSHGTS